MKTTIIPPSPRWGRCQHAQHADEGVARATIQKMPHETHPEMPARVTPSVIALTRADSFPIEGKRDKA